jgi:hypothetical protein
MNVNDELERICKVLSQDLPGGMITPIIPFNLFKFSLSIKYKENKIKSPQEG